MKKVRRDMLRGERLDDDCRKANRSSHEYGEDDPRIFCLGLTDPAMCDDYLPKCSTCGAFVQNAKSDWVEWGGQLPGQMSIEDFL